MGCELTVDLFISVDGWAGSDGLPGYFGYLGPDLAQWIATEQVEPHRAVMGRRTYQLLAGLPPEARDESWERMSRLETIVFSRTMHEAVWPNTRIHKGELVEQITRLKAEDAAPLRIVGSLSLIRQLLDAALVDRLRLLTFPLIAGPPGREAAFADLASADLELVDHQVLDGRILLVEYRPTGSDIPRI